MIDFGMQQKCDKQSMGKKSDRFFFGIYIPFDITISKFILVSETIHAFEQVS